MLLAAVAATLPGAATAEQASEPTSPVAGHLTTADFHSCAIHAAAVRCWGYGGNGQLGYGNTTPIGDDEAPASAGSVDVGAGRSATAVSAGNVHTCALLDDATVRCWGFGANGRLGYGNTTTIGTTQTPALIGPVDVGAGRTAKAISAGDGHSCAILDNSALRCWGYGFDGRLGLNNTESIGDNETPGSVGPINFGSGLTVKAVSAGNAHTCAILSDDTVRCWGFGGAGRLGYSNAGCNPPIVGAPCPLDVGRGCVVITPCTPDPAAPRTDTVGPVDLGPGRTARAISAGQFHTCAVLDNGGVLCWGAGGDGRLGTGDGTNIGDDETPGTVPPVNLGPGRTARAVSAGGQHTCAILDDNSVRCWGWGAFGQLGYGNSASVADPSSVGPVNLGPGRTATAISAGLNHTCARLDDQSVRCWGYGANGRLGYCSERTIGDDETPASVGPVFLGVAGVPGVGCPASAPPRRPQYRVPSSPRSSDAFAAALATQRARAAALESCLDRARRLRRQERRRARGLPSSRRRRALRRADVRAKRRRRACKRIHGRAPGRVTGVAARAIGGGRVQLSFRAVGTDGFKEPAARTYVIKQSRRPIRTRRAFRRAPSLCRGRCSFVIARVGANLTLTVTDLRRRARYYWTVAARDNVSGRVGPRSDSVGVRVR